MSAPATGADVRVRFSPAPTGYLHVGSARSALFNWMYARHTGGTMILRIEDTDADRSKPELVDAIRDSLGWLGIDWDEEYRQSDRFDQYRAAADSLVERGLAYYCDSTPEEVKARNEARGDGATGYDGYNRDRGLSFVEGKTVVRFRTPETGTTEYDDLIRGHISFDNSTLEDFVIVRSSGVPLFHVANAWDDLTMGITHVVRGEDLVNTVPRVLLLREAMAPLVDADPTPPVFAHLPLIVNEQRKKLSKRRDDVSVGDYRDRGFLADAMRNYLLTLGWGPRDGGDEIRPIDVFVEQFELDDINKAPAFFDVTKLEHFNGEYLRALSVEKFVEVAQSHLGPIPADLFAALAPYAQERVKVLDGIPELLGWIVDDAPDPSDKDWKKVFGKGEPGPILDRLIEALGDCDWTAAAIEETVFGVGTELDAKTQLPVRLALTGVRAGIPLWEPMAWMDRAVVLDRLRATRARLG